MWFRPFASRAAVLAAFALAAARGEAHKPITSPYTYNTDVFPIVRDRCGRCHVAGGVAPMSLLTYKDAFPWGESIRTELIAGHMPPWHATAGAGGFRNPQTLTARELNVLMTWVTGGNPMGDPDRTPPAVVRSRDWPLGPPDLVVPMPSPITMAADNSETTLEFMLPAGGAGSRLLRAVDLLPGTPAIVRSATISVKAGEPNRPTNDPRPERLLAVWVPGETPVALDRGAGFALPADAELLLRVHYKKTWETERQEMTDRSSVGVYYSPSVATPALSALTLSPRESYTVAGDLLALAAYLDPDSRLSNVDVAVTAQRPDGSSAEIVRIRPQPDWARRYWFAEPVTMPRGTRLTVTATASDALLPPGAAPIAARPLDPSAVRVTLNVIPGR